MALFVVFLARWMVIPLVKTLQYVVRRRGRLRKRKTREGDDGMSSSENTRMEANRPYAGTSSSKALQDSRGGRKSHAGRGIEEGHEEDSRPLSRWTSLSKEARGNILLRDFTDVHGFGGLKI